MKVAVATGNYKNIVGHPGRCKGFIVFTIEDGKIINKEERENKFRHLHDHHHEHDHQHGHDGHHDHDHHNHAHTALGRSIAEMLQDCDYFLAKTMGQGFINQLHNFNIKPAIVENTNDAETAVTQLLEHLKNNRNPD